MRIGHSHQAKKRSTDFRIFGCNQDQSDYIQQIQCFKGFNVDKTPHMIKMTLEI